MPKQTPPAPLILVIDDNPANRRLYAAGLEPRGFRVVSADDGPSGLEAARTLDPDIILLDLLLPGMDGFTVCDELRKTLTTPVIMITSAYNEERDEVRGLKVGADDFLRRDKVSWKVLVARIHRLLERSATRVRGPGCECGNSTCPSGDWRYHPLSTGPLEINPFRGEVVFGGETIRLGGAAFDPLLFLCAHQGQTMERSVLRRAAYGTSKADNLGGSRDVDNLVARVRRRLADLDASLIVSVHGKGYLIPEPIRDPGPIDSAGQG